MITDKLVRNVWYLCPLPGPQHSGRLRFVTSMRIRWSCYSYWKKRSSRSLHHHHSRHHCSDGRSQKYDGSGNGLSHTVSHGLPRLASTKSCAGSSLKLAPSSYLAAFLRLSIGNVHLDRLDVARLDMSFSRNFVIEISRQGVPQAV